MIRLSISTCVTASIVFLFMALPAQAGWKAPIGIPTPAFGIQEANTMFVGKTFNFGSGPEPYRDAGHGPYTHYVDNTSPSATDSGNAFGTPERPRLTIPGNLPPGSVVEVHGGPYNFRNFSDKMAVYGAGTVLQPIFVRGSSASDRPTFTKDLIVGGSYVILENFTFVNTRISTRPDLLLANSDHVALRNLEMHGTGVETGNGSAIDIGLFGVNTAYTLSDYVVYNNTVHDYGSRDLTTEADWLGVSVSGFDCTRVWIVDNDLYYLGVTRSASVTTPA